MSKGWMILTKLLLAWCVIEITWNSIDQFPGMHEYVENWKPSVSSIAFTHPVSSHVSLVLEIADEHTPIIDAIDILDHSHVKATFLIHPDWAQRNPLTLQEIQQRGYEIRVDEKLQKWSFNLEQLLEQDGTVNPTLLREKIRGGWVISLFVRKQFLPVLPVVIQIVQEKGLTLCTLHQWESEYR